MEFAHLINVHWGCNRSRNENIRKQLSHPIPSHLLLVVIIQAHPPLSLSSLPILSQIIILLCVVIRKTMPRETTTAITGTHLLLLSSLSLYINNN